MLFLMWDESPARSMLLCHFAELNDEFSFVLMGATIMPLSDS